jgi:hypothetical protein
MADPVGRQPFQQKPLELVGRLPAVPHQQHLQRHPAGMNPRYQGGRLPGAVWTCQGIYTTRHRCMIRAACEPVYVLHPFEGTEKSRGSLAVAWEGSKPEIRQVLAFCLYHYIRRHGPRPTT